MFNAFLVLRTTFFALFLTFGLLLLSLAAWNINSATEAEQHASASSMFLVFTNCLMIILIVIAKVEFFIPQIKTGSVLVECGWVVVIALFQLGGAISSTASKPVLFCYMTSYQNICASASLIIPVSWLNALITFAYFFVLSISVMSHMRAYPDIWRRTMYTVDWFIDPKTKALLQEVSSQPKIASRLKYSEAIRSKAGREQLFVLKEEPDVEKAPWAVNINVHRGKDNPYAASTMAYSRSGRSTPCSFSTKSHCKWPSASDSSEGSFPYASHGRRTPAPANAPLRPLPPLPPKTLSGGSSESSFGTKFMERIKRDLGKSSHPVLPRIKTVSLFPSTIHDDDFPIPIPHRSQWVQADGF